MISKCLEQNHTRCNAAPRRSEHGISRFPRGGYKAARGVRQDAFNLGTPIPAGRCPPGPAGTAPAASTPDDGRADTVGERGEGLIRPLPACPVPAAAGPVLTEEQRLEAEGEHTVDPTRHQVHLLRVAHLRGESSDDPSPSPSINPLNPQAAQPYLDALQARAAGERLVARRALRRQGARRAATPAR